MGARLDKHSLIDKVIVSPRANIRYNPDKNLNFRLSYSTGFRSPQAYDEDFHVAVVGGDRVVTVLADDLKQQCQCIGRLVSHIWNGADKHFV